MRNFTQKYFGTTDLKCAIEQSEILSSETPKSISCMERLINPSLEKDFPDLNVNELKSMAKEAIIQCLSAIENKNLKDINYNGKIKSWIKSKIEDLKDKKVSFDSIKFHRTTISKYEKNKGIATIGLQTSLEYFMKIDNEIGKKTQDRFKLEFIYIIDENKVDKKIRTLGLNCPNCGAPIKSIGEKVCVYCGSGIKEIVKRVWSLNNIYVIIRKKDYLWD